ncbi:MAG: histidine phosphatase family protein, partial [Gammaproteobacteria bacterium]
MALLLIRHGETDLNTGRVVQFPDTPLGAAGIAQAEALGASLRSRTLRLVVSSDYVRARMTAERIVAHTRAPLIESAHWRERHFGALRDRPYSEFGELDIFARDYVPPE